MIFVACILMGLIEAVFVWVLWISLTKGYAMAWHPTGRKVFREYQPVSYWLYVSINIAFVFFVLPYMTYVLVAAVE